MRFLFFGLRLRLNIELEIAASQSRLTLHRAMCYAVTHARLLCFQILMNAGRSRGSVKTECASTWWAASDVNAQWASSIMTSCWFVKVSDVVAISRPEMS